jgi:hypothetical protein
VELNHHSPSTPSWRGAQLKKAQGQLYLYLTFYGNRSFTNMFTRTHNSPCNTGSVSQETPCLVWNVPCSNHPPPTGPFISQINPAHTLTPCLLGPISTFSSYLRLSLQRFPSCFASEVLYTYDNACYIHHPSHPGYSGSRGIVYCCYNVE